MEKPKADDWMWVALMLKPGLIECVMEANVTYAHLYNNEPLPERLQFRRFVLLQVENRGTQAAVNINRPPSISGADLIGSISTKDFFTISEVDPLILKKVKEMYGINSLHTDVSDAPVDLKGLRGGRR